MSGFLSRLHAQQSQALVFLPCPDATLRSGMYQTLVSSEEGWQRSEERQANLLSSLAEDTPPVLAPKAAVLQPPQYQQSLPNSSLPVAPPPKPRSQKRHIVVERTRRGMVCHFCGQKFRCGQALGGHIARRHSKKPTAFKSASST